MPTNLSSTSNTQVDQKGKIVTGEESRMKAENVSVSNPGQIITKPKVSKGYKLTALASSSVNVLLRWKCHGSKRLNRNNIFMLLMSIRDNNEYKPGDNFN